MTARAIPIWTDAGLMFSFVLIVLVLVFSATYIIYKNWQELKQ
jgi:hypothetical protein